MKCLLINLDRSPERLARMGAAFAAIGVTFERVAAVDGQRLPESTIAAINGRNGWVRPLVKAEIGCLLSHLACWESIAAGDARFGAVFEDDMRISPRAGALLRSDDWIPADADLIKLETRLRAITVGVRTKQVADAHRLARLFTFHDGLGGYILSKACAARLCALIEQHTAPVDQWVLNPRFGVFARLHALQLLPAICAPNQLAAAGRGDVAASPSTIDPQGDLYRTDEVLLREAFGAPTDNRVLRELQRIAASIGRLVAGRRKVRVQLS